MISRVDFLKQFQQLTPSSHCVVAYSGGLDSHVLLHLLVQCWQDLPDLQLSALHVNHGLSEYADQWALHCAEICSQLKVPFILKSIEVTPRSGESLEALAREQRYQVIADYLPTAACLLTAHHADDQAETVLLQLLRGAGVQGLSAMPAQKVFADGRLLRPLLNFSREQLLQYAQDKNLHWIDDESNRLEHFDRNYLRHQVLPLIKQRWPQTLQTFSRSAMHCAEAVALLDRQADVVLTTVLNLEANCLDIALLQNYSLAMQACVLRRWLRRVHHYVPSTVQLQQIINEVMNSRVDAQPLFEWQGWQLRRFQGFLYLLQAPLPFDQTVCLEWDLSTDLSLPGDLGKLCLTDLLEQGIDLDQLYNHQVTVRFRQGGERLQLADNRGSRSLKKLMQAWKIPPWQRDRVPLIYVDGYLAIIVGHAQNSLGKLSTVYHSQ